MNRKAEILKVERRVTSLEGYNFSIREGIYAYIERLKNMTTASIKILRSDIDAEHNRISVLAPKVDGLDAYVRKSVSDLLTRIGQQEDIIQGLSRVILKSGIIEEAISGEDMFQFRDTVDRLQRYPLYKINKVVIKESDV